MSGAFPRELRHLQTLQVVKRKPSIGQLAHAVWGIGSAEPAVALGGFGPNVDPIRGQYRPPAPARLDDSGTEVLAARWQYEHVTPAERARLHLGLEHAGPSQRQCDAEPIGMPAPRGGRVDGVGSSEHRSQMGARTVHWGERVGRQVASLLLIQAAEEERDAGTLGTGVTCEERIALALVSVPRPNGSQRYDAPLHPLRPEPLERETQLIVAGRQAVGRSPQCAQRSGRRALPEAVRAGRVESVPKSMQPEHAASRTGELQRPGPTVVVGDRPFQGPPGRSGIECRDRCEQQLVASFADAPGILFERRAQGQAVHPERRA